MRRSLIAAITVVLGVGVAAVALRQPSGGTGGRPNAGPYPPDILFRAVYAADRFPELGWGSSEDKSVDQRWTRVFLPRGGPNGQDAARFAAKHFRGSDYGGQYNLGNRGDVTTSDGAPGQSRFYRWRMRFAGNHRGLAWDDGAGPSSMQNKLLIVGQGCGDDCRFILSYQTGDDGVENFRLQKDGGVDLVDTGRYPNGRWLDIQVELGTATGRQGAYRIWIDSNDRRRPTAQRTGIALHGTNHRYVWFGAFMNDGLMADGSHSYDHADFEIGTAFDPGWSR